MTKKVDRFEDWICAQEAARLLGLKMGFPINPEYMTKLAASKKQPVRTRPLGCHKLYNREDLEKVVVRQKGRGNA